MPSVDFQDLVPEVLSIAPSVPLPTIVRAFRNAARELCRRGECFRYEVANDVVAKNLAEHELSRPSNTDLLRPIALTINEEPLKPTSPSILDADDTTWRSETGTPRKFFRSANDTNWIRLYPIPDRTFTTGIQGEIVVQPTRTATSIDDVFLDRYQEALVDGALSKLLPVAGTTWYSPDLASYHLGRFESGILEAKSIANGGDMPKRRVVRYNDGTYSGGKRTRYTGAG